MVLKIRLARLGRKGEVKYNIVVAHARTAAKSKPLEVIGTYDPIPKVDLYDPSGKMHKDIKLDFTRAKYWVGVGAQPTETAWRLLSLVGILEPKMRLGQKPGAVLEKYLAQKKPWTGETAEAEAATPAASQEEKVSA